MMQQSPAEQGASNFIGSINRSGAIIKEAYTTGYTDGATFYCQDQLRKLKQMATHEKLPAELKAGLDEVVKYFESLLSGEEIHDIGGLRKIAEDELAKKREEEAKKGNH